MPKWFTLDGVSCEDVGMRVKEYPALVIPRRRGRKTEVPGGTSAYLYDGAWGYEDMVLSIEIYIDMTAGIDAVAAFLLPDEREIVFGDQPGYVLRGRCEDQLDLNRIMRARAPRTATINFICGPFKALQSPGAPLELTSAGMISHPGTARSLPLIWAEGEGEGTILFHGTEEFKLYDLESGKPLLIDCGAMICTNEEGTEDLSGQAEGDYPYLDPGDNSISFSGGITKLTIEPRLRWLGR